MRSAIDIAPECLAEVLAMLHAIGVKPVKSEHCDNAVRLVIEGAAVPHAQSVSLTVEKQQEGNLVRLSAQFQVRTDTHVATYDAYKDRFRSLAAHYMAGLQAVILARDLATASALAAQALGSDPPYEPKHSED